jgi:hypothetical protein
LFLVIAFGVDGDQITIFFVKVVLAVSCSVASIGEGNAEAVGATKLSSYALSIEEAYVR